MYPWSASSLESPSVTSIWTLPLIHFTRQVLHMPPQHEKGTSNPASKRASSNFSPFAMVMVCVSPLVCTLAVADVPMVSLVSTRGEKSS